MTEFDKQSNLSLIREVMETMEKITYYRDGKEHTHRILASIFAAINPIKDFFERNKRLIDQTQYKHGDFNRFDILLSMTVTKQASKKIINRSNFFSDHKSDRQLRIIEEEFEHLRKKLSNIKDSMVILSEQQQEKIKNAINNSFDEEFNNPALYTIRNTDTLLRLINTITAINHILSEQEYTPQISARDEGIIEAIDLFKFINTEKEKISHLVGYDDLTADLDIISKLIYETIKKSGTVNQHDLFREIVLSRRICKKNKFYKTVDYLVYLKLVEKTGQRQAELKSTLIC